MRLMILLCLLLTTVYSQVQKPDSSVLRQMKLFAVQTAQPPVIDGIPDEAEWKKAEPYTSFFQREPVEGAPVSEKTEVYLLYDSDALYVAALLYDSQPDSIIKRLARKDIFISADRFGIFLDPLLDKRTGYYFGLNAAGTMYDGTLYNDDWDDGNWDAVWEGKSTVSSMGWSVEMKIPFSRLRFKGGEKMVWGVNFIRDIARRNESSYAVFRPKNGSGFVSRFHELHGLSNISSQKQIEIIPYITGKAEYIPSVSGNPFNDGSKYRPDLGADLKWNLASGLTLNASVNPDFGQVEIDPAVINLSDGESFFNEKRPFFVEGDSYYSFGSGGAINNWGFNFGAPDFFYSRRIGKNPSGSIPNADYYDAPVGTRILGSAKLTGQIGDKWKIGTLHALTGKEFARLHTAGVTSETEIEPFAYYGLVRVERTLNGGNSSLGLISTYTNRSFDDSRLSKEMNKSALGFGIDGWTYLDEDKVWVITGWTGVSRIGGDKERITSVQRNFIHYLQRPDAEHLGVDSNASSLSGFAGRYTINKQKGNFTFNAQLGFVDPKFDVADMGFMFRGDIINKHIVSGYRWTEPGEYIRNANINFAYFSNHDFGRVKNSEGIFHMGNITFANYYGLNWNFSYNPEAYSKTRTRGGPLTLSEASYSANLFGWSDSRKDFVFEGGGGTYWTAKGRSVFTSLWLQWSPAPNVSLSLAPEVEWNNDPYMYVTSVADPLAAGTYGKRYIFAELEQKTLAAGIRVNWTFTPSLSLQAYIQPLASAGKYTQYKELRLSGTNEYLVYGRDGSTFDATSFKADPDGGGPSPEIELWNNDFNYISLRGNAVMRWEYSPGSVLYLVWTQSRQDFTDIPDFRMGRSISNIFNNRPENIFMLKFTYWMDY